MTDYGGCIEKDCFKKPCHYLLRMIPRPSMLSCTKVCVSPTQLFGLGFLYSLGDTCIDQKAQGACLETFTITSSCVLAMSDKDIAVKENHVLFNREILNS